MIDIFLVQYDIRRVL